MAISTKSVETDRLNPFEFRAGLRGRTKAEYWVNIGGLNPFEFRAGLRGAIFGFTSDQKAVLIPLNSGQAYESRDFQFLVEFLEVLIPLNSGQAYERWWNAIAWLNGSLNPFEFRAGLRAPLLQ